MGLLKSPRLKVVGTQTNMTNRKLGTVQFQTMRHMRLPYGFQTYMIANRDPYDTY